MTTLRLPQTILTLCRRGGDATTPLENGGIFIGRVEGTERHVEHMIGAGPRARHARQWLEVDHEWQNLQIRRFADAGANVSYLGEWHTHPAAAEGLPSWTDRRTLRLLAADKALRCPDPVMLILFPENGDWGYAAWRLARPSFRPFQSLNPRVRPASVFIDPAV